MATKVVATATVRALKGRKLMPMRAALTLVRKFSLPMKFFYVRKFLIIIFCQNIQTPAAVNRVKQLLDGKNEYVSNFKHF